MSRGCPAQMRRRSSARCAAIVLAVGLAGLVTACGHDGAPRYGGEPTAAEATYGQCAFCHNEVATHMVTTGGHKDSSLKCELCHADQRPGEFGPGHRRLPACADCHAEKRTHHDPAMDLQQPCVVCHAAHGSGNLQLIREQIDTPTGGRRSVQFVNRNGLADGSYASAVLAGTGICETCHTATRYYRADASGLPHFTIACVSCHEHVNGFVAMPPPATSTATSTRTPVNTRSPTATATSIPTDTLTPTSTTAFTPVATPTGPTATPISTPTGPSPTPTVTTTFTPTRIPTATSTPIALRVSRVSNAPGGIDDPIWNTVAPLLPALSDVSTGLLYGSGQLNMTGTFGGLADFNDGDPADLELRAVHDGDKLYILVQWSDRTFSVDGERWRFNGRADRRKPGESASGWTAQGNDDKIALAFEIQAASSEFGSFSTAGCAASCHDTTPAGGLDMRPAQGSVDIWNWKSARSEPLGYVNDEVSRADSGRVDDGGAPVENRNIASTGNHRSGPATEWDGSVQSLTRWDGQAITLDPAFFILEGHRTPFAGDAATGNDVYQAGCALCHGGAGEGGVGPALTAAALARMSRAELDAANRVGTHPGASPYNALSADDKTNVLARLRGFTGVPGYFLTPPSGSVADVRTQSNVEVIQIDDTERAQYRVLMIRPLQTGNQDDAQFIAGSQYVFGVALMDNDGRNHVGSMKEILSLDP